MHLVQDILFRHFVYDDYKWDPVQKGNIEIPNFSNHKKPLVYLTTKRENALVYLSNAVEKYCKEIGFEHLGSYYKWASYGFTKEGILELQEYWENAIEDTYAGVSGYIYSMREVPESEKLGDIPFAVTSNIPVLVEYCEYIPDAYEAIKEAADKGFILLRRFNENSEKKMQWIKQCIKAEYIKAQQFPEYKVFLKAKFKEVLK